MYQNHWRNYHKGICSLNLYGKSNSKIHSLSGFRYKDYIVTDNEVYNLTDIEKVVVCFYQEDGRTPFQKLLYTKEKFLEMLPPKSEIENLGVTCFLLPENELEGTVSLELCSKCKNKIGKAALLICYQKEQNTMSLSSAVISSNYTKDNGLTYIQFDGNVRVGINGAPLIEYDTGKVIGIVTNRELAAVKAYRKILRTVDTNLEILEKVRNKWTIEDVDPIQVLIIGQNQIKHLSRECFSNFSVKTGYALDINLFKEFFESLTDKISDSEL